MIVKCLLIIGMIFLEWTVQALAVTLVIYLVTGTAVTPTLQLLADVAAFIAVGWVLRESSSRMFRTLKREKA